jgi:hypothetical protein
MGPLEVMAIAFPGDRFKGEIIPALASAVEHRTIRIVDLTFISKDSSGTVTSYELAELEEHEAAFFDVVDETMGLISVSDIEQIAERLAANSSTAVIVFEHVWADQLERAIRGADGQVVVREPVPRALAEAALADAEVSKPIVQQGGGACSGDR